MKSIFLFLGIAVTVHAQAQISLVAKLNPHALAGSYPHQITVGAKLYFAATDSAHGYEVFGYDGTNPPAMIADLNPGAADGTVGYNYSSFTFQMGVINNSIYFAGNNGTSGLELYTYTGTGTPTLVEDIEPGTGSSNPTNFITYNNKLYFTATTTANGTEMYSFDGTTVSLIDINPGSNSSYPSQFTPFNGKIYFSASTTGIFDNEPFVYDPATNTASQLAQISPSTSNGSNPSCFTVLNNKLYFLANDATHGNELYSYDGTTAPVRLTDFAPGTLSGIYNLGGYNNYLLFDGAPDGVYSNSHLYKYDPATSTTTFINNISPFGYQNAHPFTIYNNKAYFAGTDSAHGGELWVYDGNTANIVMDLYPGSISSFSNYALPNEIVVYNGSLYMNQLSSTSGPELYKYNSDVSVQNIAFSGQISAYPNPVSGDEHFSITLLKPAKLTLKISDAAGKIVSNMPIADFPTGNSNISIPFQRFAPGIYFYHFYDGKGVQLFAGKIVRD